MARRSTYLAGCLLAAYAIYGVYRLVTGHGHSLMAIVSWGILLFAIAVYTLILTFRRDAVFRINTDFKAAREQTASLTAKK